MIDDHCGERVDLECEAGEPGYVETETLLEIRQTTVRCVVDAEIPGRSYWAGQLAVIDDEIAYRSEHEGDCAVESFGNRLWRGYVTVLRDALTKERWRQVIEQRAAGAVNPYAALEPYTGIPQTLGELIP